MKKICIFMLMAVMSLASTAQNFKSKAIVVYKTDGTRDTTLLDKKAKSVYSGFYGKENPVDDDYVKLDGTIEIVDADHLVFTGEIRTKVYHINNGQEVLRSGTYNFVTKEKRKYWRMQEISNPADNCADYIDIYFKR